VKQAVFGYVNHAQICSWNQPVLSKKINFLAQGTTGAFDGAKTRVPINGYPSTDYKTDTLPSVARHPFYHLFITKLNIIS